MKVFKNIKITAILLLLISLCTFFNSYGQWYGRNNYSRAYTFCTGGRLYSLSLTGNPWGYVIGGYLPTNTPSLPNFGISFLDEFATFGPGTFFNTYQIFDDPAACIFPAQKYDCSGIMVIGAPNTGNNEVFALAGVYTEGVFFATLDQNGNPISTYRWDWPSTPNQTPKKPFITASATAGEYYICGDFNDDTYVLKVDASPAPPFAAALWGNFYTSGNNIAARALIESPYNSSELVVVGSRNGLLNSGSNGTEAFFLKLNAASGSTITYNTYSDGSGGPTWFTSIKEASSTWGGANGYVIGGYCNSNNLGNNTYPQWMNKLDQNGNSIWSTIIEPIYSTTYSQQTVWEINDVFERYNSVTTKFENFGIGGSTIYNGSTTYDYLTVFKLDDDGTVGSLSPTEFRYFDTGGSGYFASCYLTNIETGGGGDDGLQAYAMDYTSLDHTFIKGYFNGVSGCKDSVSDISNIYTGPGLNLTPSITVNIFNANCPNLFLLSMTAATPFTTSVCYSTSITGGSNARIYSGTNEIGFIEDEIINIHPNPTKNSIFISSTTPEILRKSNIEIMNNIGQVLKVIHSVDSKINNEFGITINMKEINILPGIYYLKITTPSGNSKMEKIVYLGE